MRAETGSRLSRATAPHRRSVTGTCPTRAPRACRRRRSARRRPQPWDRRVSCTRAIWSGRSDPRTTHRFPRRRQSHRWYRAPRHPRSARSQPSGPRYSQSDRRLTSAHSPPRASTRQSHVRPGRSAPGVQAAPPPRPNGYAARRRRRLHNRARSKFRAPRRLPGGRSQGFHRRARPSRTCRLPSGRMARARRRCTRNRARSPRGLRRHADAASSERYRAWAAPTSAIV